MRQPGFNTLEDVRTVQFQWPNIFIISRFRLLSICAIFCAFYVRTPAVIHFAKYINNASSFKTVDNKIQSAISHDMISCLYSLITEICRINIFSAESFPQILWFHRLILRKRETHLCASIGKFNLTSKLIPTSECNPRSQAIGFKSNKPPLATAASTCCCRRCSQPFASFQTSTGRLVRRVYLFETRPYAFICAEA